MIFAFQAAIDTVESLRDEIVSGSGTEADKQKLAEEYNQIYRGMVEVCLELNYYDRAIEYAERSKTRNLVESLAIRDLYPKGDISEAVLNQLSRLRREIGAEQRRLEIEQKSRTNQVIALRARQQATGNRQQFTAHGLQPSTVS
ncbi:MAG: hypothetical protein AB4426_21180 [Xenococcaceae cyanobacterium]